MTKTQNAGVFGRISASLSAALLSAVALIGGATLAPPPAHAQLRAQVVGEQYIPLRIAIPDFDAAGPTAADIAKQLSDVIRSDLGSSAPFRVLDKSSSSSATSTSPRRRCSATGPSRASKRRRWSSATS